MNKPPPSADERTGRSHVSLLANLKKVEALVQPQTVASLLTVVKQLAATKSHLGDHYGSEEQGGWMDAIRRQEPRFSHTVEHLQAQRRELVHSLETLIEEAEAARELDYPLRKKIGRWVQRVRENEACETDLLEETLEADLGAGD
jgi:hypothetical protein